MDDTGCINYNGTENPDLDTQQKIIIRKPKLIIIIIIIIEH